MIKQRLKTDIISVIIVWLFYISLACYKNQSFSITWQASFTLPLIYTIVIILKTLAVHFYNHYRNVRRSRNNQSL